jgi:hypothetical protein
MAIPLFPLPLLSAAEDCVAVHGGPFPLSNPRLTLKIGASPADKNAKACSPPDVWAAGRIASEFIGGRQEKTRYPDWLRRSACCGRYEVEIVKSCHMVFDGKQHIRTIQDPLWQASARSVCG